MYILPSEKDDDSDSDSSSDSSSDSDSECSNDDSDEKQWFFVQSYILIPLNFVCFFCLLICTCGFAIVVVINGDICYGSPSSNIMAIAQEFILNKTAYQSK